MPMSNQIPCGSFHTVLFSMLLQQFPTVPGLPLRMPACRVIQLLSPYTCDAMQIFTLFVVHAYSTRIWKQQEADNSKVSVAAIEHGFQSPEGHSKLIMDGPYTLLWPCMLLWPWFQAAISYGWIHNATGSASASAAQVSLQCLLESRLHQPCASRSHLQYPLQSVGGACLTNL